MATPSLTQTYYVGGYHQGGLAKLAPRWMAC
jgi:hypothetical protein